MAQRKYQQLKFGKDVVVDEDFITWADDLFSALGLSPEMAQLAVDKWGEYSTRRLTAMETEGQQRLDALRRDWGGDFDANVAAGKKAAQLLGLTAAEVDALDMASNKAFGAATILARIGKSISGKPGETTLEALTPAQAQERIDAMYADPESRKALFDKRHPKHDQLVREQERLFSQAYPSKQPDPAPAPASTPSPAPTPAPSTGKRAAALERIGTLTADSGFQSRMRDQSNPAARDAAVREWTDLHETAYAPDPPAAVQQS